MADLVGAAIPDRKSDQARKSQAAGWSTKDIDSVKICLDRMIRKGNNADNPDEWGYRPPICPVWKWKPEFREQYNAVIDWIIGLPSKCHGNQILPNRGLWLWGNPGTGKTSLMRAIKNFCSLYADPRSPNMPRPMVWRHAKDIVAEYEADGIRALDRYCDEVATLIIDDLGTEDREAKNYGSQRNVLEEVLSRRYDKGKMTMVTTNITFDQVKAFYRPRVFDRIRETMNAIDFMGSSHRKEFNPNIK